MARQLRITVKEKDYNFTILNSTPISKSTVEIPISFEESSFTLVRTADKWLTKELNSDIAPELTEAIGRAIALRYRF